MAKSRKNSVGRRGFLKTAATGAAALVTTPVVEAQQPRNGTNAAPEGSAGTPSPTEGQLARDAGNVRPPAVARTMRQAPCGWQVQPG